jgi:NADH:ubiquinone oxidoreductase subunit F (NADH-binding)
MGDQVNLALHRHLWSEQPNLPLQALAAAAQAADLRGFGGAGFPMHRKLESMAGRRVSAVVVNGSEGEETSAKDGQLLCHVPHLVLDGAAAVAAANGCRRVIVQVTADRPQVTAAVTRAVAERRDPRITWSVEPVADRFVAGEASAIIQRISGNAAVPRDLGKPPRDPGRRIRPAHVFVSNVETFARLALASRGHRMTTALVTVSGAVAAPGVYEVPQSWTIAELGAAAGAITEPDLLITGGWHGAWAPYRAVANTPLERDRLAAAGARWGAGAIVWLPTDVRPQQVLARITQWLAAQSAGQCGPCVAGLPALADAVAAGSVTHHLADVDGRGLCAHPTATVAAVRSALDAMARVHPGTHQGGTS